MRKIIQIIETDDIDCKTLTALCDDGSVWVQVGMEWELVPTVLQASTTEHEQQAVVIVQEGTGYMDGIYSMMTEHESDACAKRWDARFPGCMHTVVRLDDDELAERFPHGISDAKFLPNVAYEQGKASA